MDVSLRTVYTTIKRLEHEKRLKPIVEEVKEEREKKAKKYKTFAVREQDKALLIYSSPIPAIQSWITEKLNDLMPKTRMRYLENAKRCWKHIVEHHAVFDPEEWTLNQVKEFINSARIRRLKPSSQNRIRTAINRLMAHLGKRDIFFEKLKEQPPQVVYMRDETKATFFRGCKETFPEVYRVPLTMGVIALKTGTRLGKTGYERRDPQKPHLDQGLLCIRMAGVHLEAEPPYIRLRDKWGAEWWKLLDEEAAKYVSEYLEWRRTKRRQWKDNIWFFGTTSPDEADNWMKTIKEKYDLYEVDDYGIKHYIHWHMFRDNFANECLLSMIEEVGDIEAQMDKGVLACCLLGGWKTTDTFVKRYLAQSTLNKIRKIAFKKIKGKITTGL